MHRHSLCLALIAAAPGLAAFAQTAPEIDGELRQWHKVTFTFRGPLAREDGTPNPFRDYRFDMAFEHAASGERRVVPGYFAADGKAGESSSAAGDRWRVHFSPNRTGVWRWRASFRAGTDVAVSSAEGDPVRPLDGLAGEFTILETNKAAPDFRGRGTLEYVGRRYLRFAGDGSYFLKGGVDSPETLLGYADFDGTYRDLSTSHRPKALAGVIDLPSLKDGLHRYEPHVKDWRPGDPSWKDGKGKGLIGGLNYLASQGVNSVYFLTMNVNGDGRNVWPWTGPWTRDRYDCSKLDQWETVFAHMTRLGMMLHVVLQETENDALLDGGNLGVERRLYVREMIARFSHHPAITWNLGEENVQTVPQQKAFAAHLRRTDPYRHHIVIHNDHWHAKNIRETFHPLMGDASFTGTALQDFYWNDVYPHVRSLVNESAAAGQPWVVTADELGGANFGTLPDAEDPRHDMPRRFGLWASLMAGGAGVEWYFGWQNNSPHSDLSAEDWRTREAMYRQTRLALDFFHAHVPFASLRPAEERVMGHGVFALAEPGETYLIYLPNGGATRLDLGGRPGRFAVQWFDPRNGGALRSGPLTHVRGPGLAWTGDPPSDRYQDWAVLIRRVPESAPSAMQFPEKEWRRAKPEELGVDPASVQKAMDLWRAALGAQGVDRAAVVRRGVLIHEGKGAAMANETAPPVEWFDEVAAAIGIAVPRSPTALELARFGHLLLNGGVWNGRRVASADRVRDAAGAGRYHVLGQGSTACIVVPEWDLVLVRMGTDEPPLGGRDAVIDSVLRKLGAGVYPIE